MQTDAPFHVLFICTGNSARSILAEALMNSLGAGRFRAWSAGSHPKGTVHPGALQELQRLQLPTEGLRSKSWDEFAAADAPKMDFIFTVCDQAAGESCPYWPGQPVTAHWGLPDPAVEHASNEAQARAFHETALTLKRRIELMLALPPERLKSLAVGHDLRSIGTR